MVGVVVPGPGPGPGPGVVAVGIVVVGEGVVAVVGAVVVVSAQPLKTRIPTRIIALQIKAIFFICIAPPRILFMFLKYLCPIHAHHPSFIVDTTI